MKRTFSLLFLLALATSSHAGLITDPLGAQPPASATATGTIGDPTTVLSGGIIDGGLTTDPLGASSASGTISNPTPAKTVPQAKTDFASAKKWINDLIGSQPEGEALRLSDLMIPDVFEALHATGREADELRDYMDWLLMTGVVVGLDGDDGLDDLTGDPEDGLYSNQGDDEVSADSANEIILGGPGSDNIILGGPGTDTLALYVNPNAVQPPVAPHVIGDFYPNAIAKPLPLANPESIILGGPGTDTIILGGPGTDTLAPYVNPNAVQPPTTETALRSTRG